MRILNIILGLMLLFFIYVQFNDADGPLWAVYYAVPALWAFLAALNPARLDSPVVRPVLAVCIFSALALVVYYWPDTPRFWQKEVYWETETAREGMGIMIATAVLLVAAFTIWRSRWKLRDS